MRSVVVLLAFFIIGCVQTAQKCPQTCDDGNLCTFDICRESTNYNCIHALYNGKIENCDCRGGSCRIVTEKNQTLINYVNREYIWEFNGSKYNYVVSLSNDWYDYYKSKSRERSYDIFVSDQYSRNTISDLSDGLNRYAEDAGFGKNEKLAFITAFVQSLPYTPDNVSTPFDDYTRYGFETLYDNGGDCEDTSILMATMLEEMGYKVVLVLMPEEPGHMAIAVKCDPTTFDYSVKPFAYETENYCYIETTGEGYRVGQIPSEFEGKQYKIISLVPRPEVITAFNASYVYNTLTAYVDIEMNVSNIGSEKAKNLNTVVELEKPDGGIWDSYDFGKADMAPESGKAFAVRNMMLPAGEAFRIKVLVKGENFETVQVNSEWVYPK